MSHVESGYHFLGTHVIAESNRMRVLGSQFYRGPDGAILECSQDQITLLRR